MSKTIKRIAPIASIALPIIAPGFGTAIGASLLGAGSAAAPIVGNAILGAGLGAAGGGGLKSAALGAATGGLAGGGGSAIAQGLGATGATAKGIGSAITSGFGTAASGGDLKDIAVNAALGGAGSYALSGGKVPFLGNVAGASLDQTTGVQGAQGATRGSGILGRVGGSLGSLGSVGSGLTNTSTGGQPMKLGSLLSAGGDLYGYMQSKNDLEDIQKMLAQQSAQAQSQFQPYSQAGQAALQNMQAPNMEALQNDPGYQFRLQQGQQAVDRSLAARGLGQSGAALKAAQEYGQGLAAQEYQDFFNRQALLANQGLGAASGLGSLYTNLGNTQAAAELERMSARNNLLSSLTRNQGLMSGLGGIFR